MRVVAVRIVAALLALAASPPPTAPPAAPPAWELRRVTPKAVEVKAQTYVVAAGDTLSRVVARTGASADAIARANGLTAPYRLIPKQKLAIPAGRYHRVGRGESGIAIARAYGVDWSGVASLNHLAEPFILREGDRLLLPSAAQVAGMSMEQRAAAFRIDIDDLVTGAEPALGSRGKPATPGMASTKPVPATIPVAEPNTAFTGRFSWPIVGRILRPYGPLASGARNDGINIAATRGTPVLAAADGVVAYAGQLAAFGNLVLVRHGGGWLTAYGHADSLLVKRGQAVSRGQAIARAGATGSADAPQVHFEIREGRKPVNPLDWLPERRLPGRPTS